MWEVLIGLLCWERTHIDTLFLPLCICVIIAVYWVYWNACLCFQVTVHYVSHNEGKDCAGSSCHGLYKNLKDCLQNLEIKSVKY